VRGVRGPRWTRYQLDVVREQYAAALAAAYTRAPKQEQEQIAALFYAVHRGDLEAPDQIAAWAHRAVGFPAAPPRPRQVKLPYRPADVQLEPPPDSRLYTGVRNYTAIATEGWYGSVTATVFAGDLEYRGVWSQEVARSYREDLNTGQRRRLAAMLGFQGRLTKYVLAKNTALLWATKRLGTAQEYGVGSGPDYAVLELNPRKLAYYWWFPDDFQEEQSYVFVMPARGPQATMAAFRRVP